MKTRKTTTVTRPRPRKHTRINPRPAALLIALAATTLAGPTLAEARTQRVQDTAASVTAINRDQVESLPLNQRDFTDLSKLTPNIVNDNFTGTTNRNNINIRGVNTNNPYGGTYIDGVYVGPNARFNSDLYDVSQVEVLRGPQGTLYGRNNGGVVNVVTKSGGNNFNDATTYGGTTGYRFNDNRFDSRINYNPNALGTANAGTGLRYDPVETGYTPEFTPNLNLGQNWNTGRLNPQLNDLPADWTPTVNTNDPGLGTTLNTNPTETTTNPTHTPTEITTASNPDTTTDTHTGNTPVGNTPVENTHQPTTEVAETGDSTGVFNQPQGNGYASYGSPCPEVNRHEINNRIANDARADAAGAAQSLIAHSQPYRFFDTNYYNTTADELANRDIIGSQLVQGLTVKHDLVNVPETPKTYYAVSGGMGFGMTTVSPPIPEYKQTVRPINANELSDEQLEGEVSRGPGLIQYYLDESGELRETADGYRERAEQWRKDAARARANAEESRKRAKNAKTADSRAFHEGQAGTYEELSDILDDSAGGLERAAANDDAAAKSYEEDAAQSAANYGQAVAEQAQRQAQAAAQAAQAQAAREAEAAQREAARQRTLELIRQSQQESQNNSDSQPNNGNRGNAPRRSSQPDGRIPRPGKEPARETVRKLLRD